MLLKDAKTYGIKKHTKGSFHCDDCLVLDKDNKVLM